MEVYADGKLIFNRKDFLGKGRYGPVFKGQLKGDKSSRKIVAVRRVLKAESIVESHLLHKSLIHPHVVSYYGTFENDIEFT